MHQTRFQVSRSVDTVRINFFGFFEKGSYFVVSEVFQGSGVRRGKLERMTVKDKGIQSGMRVAKATSLLLGIPP